MSLKHRFFQHFSRNERSTLDGHTPGQEGRSTWSSHRLVVLTLGLLNVLLFSVAIALGIVCAKANYFRIPDSDVTPLIVEMNHLRNNTEFIQANEAQAALVREKAAHQQVKGKIRERLVVTDALQRNLEMLEQEKEMLQANETALEENCARCRPGWRVLGSRCYYFTNLETSARRNWNDSRADCISRGSDLVVIDNLEEHIFLNENSMRRNALSWYLSGFWVGLTGPLTDGTWAWINNGKTVNSTQWRFGQPNQSGSQTGKCGAFANNDRLKTLYNANCQHHFLNWVCEMDQTTM